MKLYLFIVCAFAYSIYCHGDDTVFRPPFTLQLHIDKEQYFKAEINKSPYVIDNSIVTFKGDDFLVDMYPNKDGSIDLKYTTKRTNLNQLDIKFSQEFLDDGRAIMLLHVHNKSDVDIMYDAYMILHDRKGSFQTSIIGVQKRISSFENWPHPIIQLTLNNFRIVTPKAAATVEQDVGDNGTKSKPIRKGPRKSNRR